MMPKKEPHERAVKKGISLPFVLLIKATSRQKDIGLATLSDYLQALIRADTAAKSHNRSLTLA